MRRDVCYMFPVSVDQLYKAYLTAATNDRFRREPEEKPYHTLSFGLNFSMKYNFNGGACTLHFMPYQGGSAVNMRFSIAQLAGARYEKYAQDLTEAAANVINSMWRKLEIDVEIFLQPENMITPNSLKTAAAPAPLPEPKPVPAPEPVPAPVVTPRPAPAVRPVPVVEPVAKPAAAQIAPAPIPAVKPVSPAPAPTQRICAFCGRTVRAGDRFCVGCGRSAEAAVVIKPPENVCGKCGAKTQPGDRFCCACGNPL